MPLFTLKFFCSGLKEQQLLIFNCISVINAGIRIVNTFLVWREVALKRCEWGGLPVMVLRLTCSYGSPVGRLIVIQRSKWLCESPPPPPWMNVPSARGREPHNSSGSQAPGHESAGGNCGETQVCCLLFLCIWLWLKQLTLGCRYELSTLSKPM